MLLVPDKEKGFAEPRVAGQVTNTVLRFLCMYVNEQKLWLIGKTLEHWKNASTTQ